jgi:hypothetical protein
VVAQLVKLISDLTCLFLSYMLLISINCCMFWGTAAWMINPSQPLQVSRSRQSRGSSISCLASKRCDACERIRLEHRYSARFEPLRYWMQWSSNRSIASLSRFMTCAVWVSSYRKLCLREKWIMITILKTLFVMEYGASAETWKNNETVISIFISVCVASLLEKQESVTFR